MKMKSLCTALVIFCLLFQGMTLYANEITSVQSSVSDRVDIVINCGSSAANKPVIVKIEKVTETQTELNYMTSGYTDENGRFSFSYINDRQTGLLKITANVNGTKYFNEYLKMGDNEYQELIDALNAGLNAQPASYTQIKAKLLEYDKGIALDKTRFDALSDKEAVYNIMVNNTAYKGKVSKYKDVRDDYYSSVLMQSINENKDCYNTLICEEPYKEVVESFSSLVPEMLTSATEQIITAVKVEMDDSYTDISKLATDIELLLLKKSIYYAEHWNDVKTILKKYADAGKLDIDIEQKSDVFKSFMTTEYDSYAEYESAFKSYTSQKKNQVVSSGGGGGGGGARIPTPAPSVPATVVQPEESTKGVPKFSDMDDAKWAIVAVDFTTERGITAGVGEGKFEQNRFITRAEAAKLVLRMIDAELVDVEQKFSDVPQDNWAFEYVNTAHELGIVLGKADNTFDPDAVVTRQEMAVMTYRALVYKNGEVPSAAETEFLDKELIGDWAVDAVNHLYSKKIMVGLTVSGGYMFRPTYGITRAEGATVVYNVLK